MNYILFVNTVNGAIVLFWHLKALEHNMSCTPIPTCSYTDQLGATCSSELTN